MDNTNIDFLSSQKDIEAHFVETWLVKKWNKKMKRPWGKYET
jgi:hypothetical protein